MMPLCRRPIVILHPQIDQQEYSEPDHKRTKNLAHREGAKHKSQLDIWFSKELDQEPEYSVEEQKYPQKVPVGMPSVFQHPQNKEEDAPFQRALVKLRGMAWKGPSLGKNHAPGDLGDPAIKFAIDEISNPAQA